MYRLLAKTAQHFKILCTSNNNNTIKISTMKFSSVVNQSQSSNQMNINYYSRKIHIGLPLQVKTKADESKSSLFLQISGREDVERKYFWTWTKPEKSLFKNRSIIIVNDGSKTPLGKYLASDLISVIVVAGIVLWILSLSGPTDPQLKLDEVNEKLDRKVKKAKIKLDYWTILDETMKDFIAIIKIMTILQTDKMAQKATEEMAKKPKEEWNPELLLLDEKLKELKKYDPKVLEQVQDVLVLYGNIWSLTQEQKKIQTENLRRVYPVLKKCRKDFEEIYSMIQNLNIQDFDNDDDTEAKNNCP